MSARQITHSGGHQIVTSKELRRVLRAHGEACYCAPCERTEWDAGICPQHGISTRQVTVEAQAEHDSE